MGLVPNYEFMRINTKLLKFSKCLSYHPQGGVTSCYEISASQLVLVCTLIHDMLKFPGLNPRYVGIVQFLFMFSNFYRLDIHHKSCVALANL